MGPVFDSRLMQLHKGLSSIVSFLCCTFSFSSFLASSHTLLASHDGIDEMVLLFRNTWLSFASSCALAACPPHACPCRIFRNGAVSKLVPRPGGKCNLRVSSVSYDDAFPLPPVLLCSRALHPPTSDCVEISGFAYRRKIAALAQSWALFGQLSGF
ncbi:uncharacterized protein B0I36DRAFT_115452 [Microdochium trichocladiopsis]|uniref:Uncharacterized protein n=1 Tax=Microdochium trichocladiopsis TaxID=1682393 RepID=A0A9P8Y8Z4_9PEZI|nr:uncharacterized protein B0I36DRAFT_115452 [Microdochium trichocladiopsis]KAH7030885.1 hypothetical protein B0I36DRAFT_115452 [Microdochium trichocladiopsis]